MIEGMRKKDQEMVKEMLKKGLQFVDPTIFKKHKTIEFTKNLSLDKNEDSKQENAKNDL